MNIHDYWPTTPGVVVSTVDQWMALLNMRARSFFGFYEIEVRKGIMPPKVHFESSKGQEVLRLMFFRVLEEASEAVLATDEAHWKEELIDAFNYLLSILLLDPKTIRRREAAEHCHAVIMGNEFGGNSPWLNKNLNKMSMGILTVQFCGHLADTFRNRAWMHQSQDMYFTGKEAMLQAVRTGMIYLLNGFFDFDEFWRYFVAKDMVLKFRLRSNY